MKKIAKKAKYTNKIFMGISVLLAALNVVQFYMYKEKQKDYEEINHLKQLEIFATYTKLDSISGQLQKKIVEIESLGGDIDSLLTVQNQLEKDKQALKTSKDLATERYDDIKDKIEAYEYLLQRKDQEIVRLKGVNKELLTEVIDLKEERNELNTTISQLKYDQKELNSKVHTAGLLEANNIRFTAVSNNRKQRTGDEFRVRHLSTLLVHFTLSDNPLAEVGTKEIILRIIEPEGSVLYQAASGSKTFNYKDEKLFFSLKQDILFDNSQQQINFQYLKGSEFKKGQHKVEIYCEGKKIGSAYFIVK